jgi:homoserine O-acetyltransferase
LNNARKTFFVSLLFSLVLVLALSAQAASLTRSSGVEALNSMKQYYAVPNFKIGGTYEPGKEASYEFGGSGGVTLESLGGAPLQTAYIAVGTPQKDAEGKIINAVIISSYYSGDATSMYDFWYEGQKGNGFSKGAVVGPGKLIDTDKYYVVFLDALGLWGTSKPSDGLGMKFPKYNYQDYVQANYRLLKDHLKVGKVKLATGVSMGAIQSYVWAVLHPDYVEAILPIGGIVYSDPVSTWLFTLMTSGMQSDPAWRDTKGNYYHLPKEKHPNQGMMFGWSILKHTGLTFDLRIQQGMGAVNKEIFVWEPKGDQGANLVSQGKDYDVNDLLYRNFAGEFFDIRNQLPGVKAKALIVHVKNDQWLRYVLAEEAAKKVPGARLEGFESPLAHYAVFQAPNVMQEQITGFFKEIGMK